jgi:signal peptidase II
LGRPVSVGNALRGVPPASSGPLPRIRYVTYFGLAILGCAADLFSKQIVFRWRGLPRHGNEWWIVKGRLGIETSVNPGALFGMGAGGWWFFALVSVIALLGIITWLFVFRAAHDRWITVALGFIVGAAVASVASSVSRTSLSKSTNPSRFSTRRVFPNSPAFQRLAMPLLRTRIRPATPAVVGQLCICAISGQSTVCDCRAILVLQDK